MKNVIKYAAFLCALLAGQAAQASTLNLNFDVFANSIGAGGQAAGAPVGPISFVNSNHAAYGLFVPHILLGDDGWDSQISFDATPGNRFDATSIDLIAGFQNIWRAPLSGAVPIWDEFAQLAHAEAIGSIEKVISPNLIFKGFREGAVVAHQSVTYTGEDPAPKTITFNSVFSDLDSLLIMLDFKNVSGFWPAIIDNMLYHCPLNRCGLVEMDNLVLNISAAPAGGSGPAAVPLPGAGWLMVLGLVGLARAGRGVKA